MYDVFIICPVRSITPEQVEYIGYHVDFLENKRGLKVYWPYQDTDQTDDSGYEICKANRQAILASKEVHFGMTQQVKEVCLIWA